MENYWKNISTIIIAPILWFFHFFQKKPEKYGRNQVSSDVLEEIGFFRKKPNPGDNLLEIYLVPDIDL